MTLSPSTSIDKAKLSLDVGGYSCAGSKVINSDAFVVNCSSNQNVVDIKGIVACIADGASCSDYSRLASQTAVTHFIDDYYSTPDSWSVKKSAAKVLHSLNSWLFQHTSLDSDNAAHLPHNKLLTTFSTIVFKSTTAHIFHVGDSRIYRYREGQLEQLTRDHTFKQAGQTFLSRGLGLDSRLEVDFLPELILQDDLYLLSTDGFHSWIDQRELKEAFNTHNTNLESLAKSLVQRALDNGSDDNASCLLLRVASLPLADIDEAQQRLTRLAIPPVMDVGNSIDSYIVKKILHSGSRSHVYLVEHGDTQQRYVIKAPSQSFSDDLIYLEGFVREEWVGRRIDHPSIMKIFPRTAKSQFLYHLSEYVEGITLRQWMYDNPLPSLNTVREIAAGIISALRIFQRKGMVHRDLKPENIMIDNDGTVKLIDFGAVQVDSLEEISRLLSDDVPVGARDYCAPEYKNSAKGFHCSDIFSLGIIIYEMLSAERPYKSTVEIERQYRDEYCSIINYREDIPLWFDLALEKACNKIPNKRYQAMSELFRDMSTPNKSLIAHYQSAPLIERSPLVVWKSLCLLLLAALLVQFIYYQ